MTTSATAAFNYHRPSSVEEASRLLSRGGGSARLIAGGHSLIPLMKTRLVSPDALIDLSAIDGLSGITSNAGGLTIGAMTTYEDIQSSADVQSGAQSLAEGAGQVADVQVRNWGTIGGSLAHSDPAADLTAVVLALEATINARSARASRTIPADRFFKDFLTTALRGNEVLTEIQIPSQGANTGTAYTKLANKASHYALVGVAATIQLDGGGTCTKARIGVTGAGPFAKRARRAERILEGKELTEAVIRRAAQRVGVEYDGMFNEDIHASAEYREAMAKVIGARAITTAADRAG
jgi:carbon-monoxide dehydrogenase medium subunit